jgi:AbrB family looped-hinge helix DNA binding protein
MRVTSKGQVTIPKEVRDKLGIAPGSDVGFAEDDGGKFVLINQEELPNEDAAERMIRHMVQFGRTAKRIPMTDKELMELTRGPFNDLDAD